MKQVWIDDVRFNRLCKYCKKNGTKMQNISTKAIEIGLIELERQQKEIENR